MPFLAFEDVIDNIVDGLFLDKVDDDGVWDDTRLPKNFLALALVCRAFVNPVRRNLYRDLHVEGVERFLLLTGQLRFCPHLAKFVRSADLYSTCSQTRLLDGYQTHFSVTAAWEPRSLSATAFRWFLEACPQLTIVRLYGGDMVWALSVQSPPTVKLTEVHLTGCRQCENCMGSLQRGWLKNIVAFPCLKELDISELSIGGEGAEDIAFALPARSSLCTGLSISNINKPVVCDGLSALFRSMSGLRELVLDGLAPMRRGQLKKCLDLLANTLELLTITDYHSQEGRPRHWEDSTIASLHRLKILSLNGVPVTPSILDKLPSRIEHLRVSRLSVIALPVPVVGAWLRRDHFPLKDVLKKLEMIGELRANSAARGRPAAPGQVDELAHLCDRMGIEWIHRRERHC
ncbi:unnamed protein product [Mycena citricolor]|uniref:Uncharacterized protein n=1 Tax=Mycena citricolor TaxID=2018698 RepID=A0AAD2GZV6_9AGAR|nr:unnamed protein product [Mycena citricolor]